ncbi:N-6 DNA methylase [Rhodobacteraceae bacterium MCCB 386]|nr:N-6 DNA methylase [Roseitranquillus sediminis]
MATHWSERFGLATSPFFGGEVCSEDGTHTVMLDGGYGSFALSETEEAIWRDNRTASWAWSSNLPHHVTVSGDVVAVRRWDRHEAEQFSRSSVEGKIGAFYEYLTRDRVRSTQRVVEHVLSLFRGVRSLVADRGMHDEKSIEAFLGLLDHMIAGRGSIDGGGALADLPSTGISALLAEYDRQDRSQALQLLPSLAVRHASSDIFQEAHFELVRTPSVDLFGYAGQAEARPATRGGAHFTPAPLARSIAENTLAQITDLSSRESLTVLDPACGSGAFLQEALRCLRRQGYGGPLRIVGRDISEAAVAMARFVVGHAVADWSGRGGIEVDIATADSLADPLPTADVVLMNPPFIAWGALSSERRDQVKSLLGARLEGRGDLSMAFVTLALDRLAPGGAIGVLLPASLLSLSSAKNWRADILERAELRLLASLGEYGLFAHALVQVAAAVISKPMASRDAQENAAPDVRAVRSANTADATGDVLRMLRKTSRERQAASVDGQWEIYDVPAQEFHKRPTWRLASPRLEDTLARLAEAGGVRLGDLFDVRQGVRTGDNKTFVLNRDEYNELPKRERRYFRQAVMNVSIRDGKADKEFWVFYPYGENTTLPNEEVLKRELPHYFRHHLKPRREALTSRPSLRGNLNWWDLSERRLSWALNDEPRIISKYFGGPGGFLGDLKAVYIAVQGFTWFPKWDGGETDDETVMPISKEDLVSAYVAFLNSSRFSEILEYYAPHVAGGQFDLSPRYVNHVIVPNLAEVARDRDQGLRVSRLVQYGREPAVSDPTWMRNVNKAVSEFYGFEGVEGR